MAVPATSRLSRTFEDRAEALSHFFARAAEAPRFLAFDDAVGCPLDQALAVVEWTEAAGILHDEDLLHAAWIRPDSAAAVVERHDGQRRLFAYFGPRLDQPYADPGECELIYDGPGVRAYAFAERGHAVAHFLRATQGIGAMLALLGRRAPQLLHVRRWLKELFSAPPPGGLTCSTLLVAGWFATAGAGCLFLPAQSGEPYCYSEVGIDS
ncbi:MAG: hypothetical protein ACREMF_06565 [Gemmatimonadales bacterium]